jgi:hypothetical protein
MSKRILLIFFLAVFLPGCAGLYGNQPPAPVYGGHSTGKVEQAPASNQQSQKPVYEEPADTVETEPLKEPVSSPKSIEFKPETLPEESETDSGSQAAEQTPLSQSLDHAPANAETVPAPEPQTLTPFEPLESSASLSPAVDALVLAANQKSSSGNLEVASATIERAIRIEPRNANLYYKLALIRLEQSKPRLAEDLAKKSALLAVGDSTLKKHSWLLIAHARELQGNFKTAKEARAKANHM